MSVNNLELRAADKEDLAQLPVGSDLIFDGVWQAFLPEAVQWTLELLAVLGAPIHEHILRSASSAIRTPDGSDVERGLRLGWLAAERDPYTDERTLRFAEPTYREVAERRAERLVQSTRRRLRTAAVEAAVSLPAESSNHARVQALEHAVALIGDDPAEIGEPAVAAFDALTELLWRRDRVRAAELAERAVHSTIAIEGVADPLLVAQAAIAWKNAGDRDAARRLLVLGGEPLLLRLAHFFHAEGRHAAAMLVAVHAVAAELAAPGISITDGVDPPLVELVHLIGSARHDSGDDRAQDLALQVVAAVVDALTAQRRHAEAAQFVRAASGWYLVDPATVARFSADAPDDLGLEPVDAVAAARLALDARDWATAATELRSTSPDTAGPETLALARLLMERGGADYGDVLGTIAIKCGLPVEAAAAFRAARTQALTEGRPADDRELLWLGIKEARALAFAGDADAALRAAEDALAIADRADEPADMAGAMTACARAHALRGDDALAEALLTKADALLTARAPYQSAVRYELSAVRCDIYGRTDRWPDLQAVIGAFPPDLLPHSTYVRRIVSWRNQLQWRADPSRFVDELIKHAALRGLQVEDVEWLRAATGRAIDRQRALLRDISTFPASVFPLAPLRWLSTMLPDAADAARLHQLSGR
jgi:hypothetical protein